jgi:hypothetical protein
MKDRVNVHVRGSFLRVGVEVGDIVGVVRSRTAWGEGSAKTVLGVWA